MKKLIIYIILLLFTGQFFSSCSNKLYISQNENQPLINVHNKTERYNMQIDFGKHHFSGMLIVREMKDGEIRLVFDSYFGLSIFDLGLKEQEFYIHSMIDPLKGKRVQNLLEYDFKHLFLKDIKFRKIIERPDYTQFKSGRMWGKTFIYLYKETEEKKEHIQIRHPWLGLKLELEKI